MQVPSFTHLHVHSHYSLLDGAFPVPDLVDTAVRADMGHLALTDHGNLFGAIEFYETARRSGINPILGMEAYLVRGDATAAPEPGERRRRYHVTLLATSARGFRSLSRLSSLAYLKGLHRKPCLDKAMLAEHGRDLIALSGCLSGEVTRQLLANDVDGACSVALEYAEALGKENFYLEVMSNGLEPQRIAREAMPEVARRTGLKLVATNDIHYRCQGDSVAQDALICIGTNQRMHDTDRRFRIETDELYFRTSEEMARLFGADSEAYRSTAEIASRCNIELDLQTRHLPRFDIPSGESPEEYLRGLCERGLVDRYGSLRPDVRDRFELEFEVIRRTGFISYFLIVWDLVHYARSVGIPVGPGRGSAAGSIVSYSLGITQLDPLKYNLLFERFLNADRISMPDIDIDFCRERREEIIEYARNKYGRDQVCQIVTFGTMAARAAIRDAGRVLDIPLREIDRIAKRVPEQAQKVRLGKSIAADPELAAMFDKDDQLRELLDISQRIEGMPRNTSTHAAGVVITDRPLMDLVPLCVVQGQVNTQFQMNDLERIGLLKMDFLGLKNLTVLAKVADLVHSSHGVEIDYENLPLDDPETYALLKRGDCSGVFQLESPGMRDLVARLQPDCFEDIVSLIALFRPGPLQSGMTESFVNRKHGVEPVEYAHPLVEPILRDTYGAMLYQEQVMLLAQALGGLALTDADGLRKAMGKKDTVRMASYEGRFLEGCARNDISSATANQIWSDMSRFAEYGFNKSHSAAYGVITFRTAYMKAHYPGEFMAALMSCEANNTDKLVEYVEDARRSGRSVLRPDINASQGDFCLDGESVRFGLCAVKGVGNRVVQAIIGGRRAAGHAFHSLAHVLDFVDSGVLNRASLDALIKAGTFDELEPNRSALLASSERLLRDAARSQEDRASGQAALFGANAASGLELRVRLDPVPPPTARQIVTMERDSLGLPLTVDPMAEYRALLRLLSTHDTAALREAPDRAEVSIGGLVNGLRTTVSQRGRMAGRPMGIFRLQGMGGSVHAVLFPRAFERYRELMEEDRVALFKGVLDRSREEPSLLVDEVLDPANPTIAAHRRLVLDVQQGGDREGQSQRLNELKALLPAYPGPTETYLSVEHGPGIRSTYRLGNQHRVAVGVDLTNALENLLGEGNIHLR